MKKVLVISALILAVYGIGGKIVAGYGSTVQKKTYVVADPSSADASLINKLPAGYSIVWVESTKTEDPKNTVYIMLMDYNDRIDIEEFVNQGKKVYVLPEGYIPPREAPVTDLSIPSDAVPKLDPIHIPPRANQFESFTLAAPLPVCNNHEVVGGVVEPYTGSCSFPVDRSNEIRGYFRILDTNSLPMGNPPWRYYVVTNNDAPGNLEFVADYGRRSSTIRWANFFAYDWSGSGGKVCVNKGTKPISSFGSCYRVNINGTPHLWYVVGSWHRSWPWPLPWCSNYSHGNGVLIWNFCTSQYETFYFKEFNRGTTYGCPQFPFFGEIVGDDENGTYNCPPIDSNGVFYLNRGHKACSNCPVQYEYALKSLGYRCVHALGSRYSYIVNVTSNCGSITNCKYQNVTFKDPSGTNHCP